MSLLATFLVLLLAVWAYMTLGFVVARLTNRTDVVDSAWGLGFVVVAWAAWLLDSRQADLRLLAAGFVSLWGIRLFTHITRRTLQKTEDYRYVAYREKWAENYWLKAYLRIFLTQGGLLLAVSLPVIAIMSVPHHEVVVWLAVVGFMVWGVGIIFEAEADSELQKFIKTKQPGQIMTTGLWRYSRHPNYFGEVMAWWGAALVAASLNQWWGIAGAVVITWLITKVSGLPPLEKHYEGNKAFEAYKKHTSVFVPLPRKS